LKHENETSNTTVHVCAISSRLT